MALEEDQAAHVSSCHCALLALSLRWQFTQSLRFWGIMTWTLK